MVYSFTGRGLAVSVEMQSYTQKRFEHVERLLGTPKIEPFLSMDFEFHAGENVKYALRATLDTGNTPLHVECTGVTLHEAIDAAAKALGQEIGHNKGKHGGFARRQAARLKEYVRGLRH